MKNQRGLAPILIILLTTFFLASIVFVKNQFKQKTPNPLVKNTQSNPSPQPTPTPSTNTITLKPTNGSSSTPLKTSSPNPSSTANPTLSPKPTSTPSQTAPTVKKNTCDINVTYGKLSGDSSDPLLVTLVYSFSSYNNTYMAGAQWDFDGDGSWDTDLKQSNGTIEHTFGSAGMYRARLQVQDSNGAMTDVCTKDVNITSVALVTLRGQIYNDLNCNNVKDSGEAGVAGIKISMMTLQGGVFGEVTTDSSGNYSYTKNIKPSDSITIQPAPSDHNLGAFPPSVTLSSQNPQANIDISHCP